MDNFDREYGMGIPLVSIVIITYNSALYVVDTLQSAMNQSYQHIELIISDDSSSDDTIKICQEWIMKNKTRFVRTELITAIKNTGISANCNRGVKVATGEWVKILAGDDVLERDILQKYVEYINGNENISVIYSNVQEYRNEFKEDYIIKNSINGIYLPINEYGVTASDQYNILLRSNNIWASTLFVKASALKDVNYFDERYPMFEDRPLLLNLTRKGYKIHFLNINGAKYRRHDQSVQFNRQNKYINQFRLDANLYFLDNHKSDLSEKEYFQYKLIYKKDKFLQKYINVNTLFVKLINWLLTHCILLLLKLKFWRQV